jgi:hypothetical protein
MQEKNKYMFIIFPIFLGLLGKNLLFVIKLPKIDLRDVFQTHP